MSEPISFPSTTSNFALPLLFSGQAQREFFVNQSLSMIDALIQFAIVDMVSTPPADPIDAQCYIVGTGATGDWLGQDDNIAVRLAGDWHFVIPTDRMQVVNRTTGQTLNFSAGWVSAVEPPSPSGGTVIDTEARAAISGLIQALRVSGVFADPA